MAKIRLVGKKFKEPIAEWVRPFFDPYFNIEYYDPELTYNSCDTVYYTSVTDPIDSTAKSFLDHGFRVVLDNLAEIPMGQSVPGVWVMENINWFWYYESLRHQHQKHSYTPNRNYQNLALMPMRLKRQHRDLLLLYMSPWLDQFVWSYVEQGRALPGDKEIIKNPNHQRYFDPSWYDSTHFSVVAETQTNSIFPTEKTFKPIAFYHPFMIAGSAGSLAHLRQQGFVTFDNLFDESYDLEPDYCRRLKKMANNVKNYTLEPYNTETQNRLQHNADLYYNKDIIKRQLTQEIIEPLLHYAQTR